MEFFESIQLLDGQLLNTSFHLERMNRTINNFEGTLKPLEEFPLTEEERSLIGLYKYRISYNLDKITDIRVTPYRKRQIGIVYYLLHDHINYSYKFEDRTELNNHNLLLEDHEEVIFVKCGMLTDALYSNIALFNGKEWHTPKHPLLKGTKRAQLLAEGKIKEVVILHSDLNNYEKISFINALNDLDETTLAIDKG